jgi:myotubularin-related protein 5/13
MQKAVSSPIKTELKGVGESNWYQTVGSCLAYASMCAELIQVEQVSVLVALESGWDLTSVLVALTEIILDSTYRTIDGFQTIIEREFLSFGHRFSTNGINELHNAPNAVFILFLDAVSQLIFQNPTSFEFSSFYMLYKLSCRRCHVGVLLLIFL